LTDEHAPQCVSLFSGCGGIDLGLERAGFQIIFANDSDPRAHASHKRNFPTSKFYCGSVEDLDRDKICEVIGRPANRVALLAGGPPCPPYSKSRFYRKDKPRALDDPVGDVTLNGYLRLLGELQPRAFLFENVPGFRACSRYAAG